MAENRISLINAGLEKTPDQNCLILNKRRGRLIEKIRYVRFLPSICNLLLHRLSLKENDYEKSETVGLAVNNFESYFSFFCRITKCRRPVQIAGLFQPCAARQIHTEHTPEETHCT